MLLRAHFHLFLFHQMNKYGPINLLQTFTEAFTPQEYTTFIAISRFCFLFTAATTIFN